MRKKDLLKILSWLSQVLNCPVCGKKIDADSARVLDHRSEHGGEEQSVLMHADCDSCRSSMTFSVAVAGQEVFALGALSDLTAQEALKFRNKNPITTDEVLEMHSFLKTFDGDFERALR